MIHKPNMNIFVYTPTPVDEEVTAVLHLDLLDSPIEHFVIT